MADPMRATESVLNPTDIAVKSARGDLRADMTIREFYESIGLDVDRNTLADAGRTFAQQARMARPSAKVQAMAQGGGSPPDLDQLLGRIK